VKDELIAKCLSNFVLGTDDLYVLLRDDGNGLCKRIDDKGVFPERYAKRIVECVRACEGIPSSILSAPGYSIKAELDNFDEQINMRLRAEQGRDALLAVAKELSKSGKEWYGYAVPIGVIGRLDAAIAKAEWRLEGENVCK